MYVHECVLYVVVLCCAVLCCAVLCCAALCCAVLRCAALCCAVLRCAVLCCVVLLFRFSPCVRQYCICVFSSPILFSDFFFQASLYTQFCGPQHGRDPCKGNSLVLSLVHIDHFIERAKEDGNLLDVYRWLLTKSLMSQVLVFTATALCRHLTDQLHSVSTMDLHNTETPLF